jgi:hypothetical protein
MSRNLLDERTFASWIADQVGASNLAQLGFAASLMDQFLHLLWKSIMVARPAIRACVDQLAQASFITWLSSWSNRDAETEFVMTDTRSQAKTYP